MIRYLQPSEKLNSRSLWEEIFTDDSKGFLDYYYTYKTLDNHILVNEQDYKLTSMLHLNPYLISALKNTWKSYYIVAVATMTAYRHQGHMRALLEQSLLDMSKERIPFTFLMPANEAIYTPFDFTYIYQQEKWELLQTEKLLQTAITSNEYKKVADFVNETLSKEYDIYSIRNKNYIQMIHQECLSEHGDIKILYDQNGIAGCYCYGEKEQRELVCLSQYRIKKTESKPAIMARIVNLQEFIKVIRLKNLVTTYTMNKQYKAKSILVAASLKEEAINKKVLKLNVEDTLISSNNGLFLWKLHREGSTLEAYDLEYKADNLEDLTVSMGIKVLTSWLFGYVAIEELWDSGDIICSSDTLEILKQVQVFEGIFLDEIV